LTSPQVDQSANSLTASWFVGELSCYRLFYEFTGPWIDWSQVCLRITRKPTVSLGWVLTDRSVSPAGSLLPVVSYDWLACGTW